jgi:hypothetical protein
MLREAKAAWIQQIWKQTGNLQFLVNDVPQAREGCSPAIYFQPRSRGGALPSPGA